MGDQVVVDLGRGSALDEDAVAGALPDYGVGDVRRSAVDEDRPFPVAAGPDDFHMVEDRGAAPGFEFQARECVVVVALPEDDRVFGGPFGRSAAS